jgi:hypothetical protein
METPPPLPKPALHPRDPVPWPLPIGTVAIILGVLGTLWGGIRIAQAFMGQIGGAGGPSEGIDTEAVETVIAKWQPVAIATGALYIPVGLILLAGGILLIKRRPLCVPVIRVWAILKLIAVGVNSYFQYLMATDQMAVMFSEGALGSDLNVVKSVSDATVIAVIILAVLWMSALPFFLLFWFGRPRIRSEIVMWRNPAG